MKPRFSSQVVIGLMVIAVGVIFTLDNLGIIYAEDYLRYWPTALVLIGAVKVWNARKDGHGWFSGLLFLGGGSYMLINQISYIRIDRRVYGVARCLCRVTTLERIGRHESIQFARGDGRRGAAQQLASVRRG